MTTSQTQTLQRTTDNHAAEEAPQFKTLKLTTDNHAESGEPQPKTLKLTTDNLAPRAELQPQTLKWGTDNHAADGEPQPQALLQWTSQCQKQPAESSSPKRSRQPPARAPVAPPAALEDRWRGATEEDVQPPLLPFRPKRTPGVQLDRQGEYKPSDVFRLFFSKEVMRTLCSNTNLYAAQRTAAGMKRQWTDVEAEEMLQFISIIIYLGLMKPAAARDLWRKDRLHTYPFPATVMPGYRFEAIMAYLHMSDPAADKVNDQLRGTPMHDGLCRLKPLQEQILTACRAYYHPHQNLAVDERMVATKAKIGMKQYMKDKPTKWGYKLFVLADSSNGYTCEFSIYEGKARTPSGNGLSFDAVVDLLHVPYLGTGYHVYVDNFYTSSKLFCHLHSMGFRACGTIRENRVGFPKTDINALPKNAQRGDMRWIRDGSLLFVKWRDSRDVTLCSTIHRAYSGDSMSRRTRDPETGTWSSKHISVPEPVMAYNKYMGGVDLSDALIKYYSVTRKTSRWYVKLFLHFIDIAVVNSFIIHKEMALARQKKPLTQKRFRELLCIELADCRQLPACPSAETTSEASPAASAGATSGAVSSSPPQGLDQGPQGCFPVPVCKVSTNPSLKASQGRRKCVHCKMNTIYMCRSCNVPLCIIVDRICFTEWHDKKSTQ
ncbi:piggyBac transposable element-derived protein 4-like [Alosa sapidissima]|uniref:piggyBac transposable element-derived protein 4-like n=1 Tax=Alosa sapidissima TaxID=34773 RepID=UPI001C08659C|nr:piggyBac transposable element-derived protein 4-like [Alosa sapidissima]XP_041939677.1 piggyBac transposable element-derived protein 4-like [Alosa sapidissima]XP_041939678.1 piggyBac transposable element-derived protein 4-like [Alosa sapidissima]